jgi:transposase
MVRSLLMDNSLSKEATDWREGRRLRAWELKQEGWSQQQIAQALGVSKGAVSQWMKRGREGGVQAGYAPDLNPDEGVWKHLKCVELKNLCCQSLSELKVELRKAKERLRHKRDVILGCIRQPGFEV